MRFVDTIKVYTTLVLENTNGSFPLGSKKVKVQKLPGKPDFRAKLPQLLSSSVKPKNVLSRIAILP